MKPNISQSDFDAMVSRVTEIDWARLAAFIDGEGTIMISKTKPSKKGRGCPTYVLTVLVANTDLLLMDWLTCTFGGRPYFSHSMSQRKWSNRTCYSWRVFDKRAVAVLERCLPYFIVKRQQAETGLAFRNLTWNRGRKITVRDIADRENYRNLMCSLNNKTQKGAEVVQ